MNEKILFAERLKETRQKADISQAELSRRTGIASATLSSYEKGKMPPIDKAFQIAQALNVSLDWLCGNQATPESNVAEFCLEEYLKSLAITLFEMSTEFEFNSLNHKATITISNRRLAYYCKRVDDLLRVYRGGLFSDEMYISCIDKLVSEFNDCFFVYGNVLDAEDANEAENSVFHIVEVSFGDTNSGGVYETTINDEQRSLLISYDMFKKMTNTF